MKRLLGLMIILALALIPVQACAANGDIILGLDENGSNSVYFERVFTDGDTLYLQSWNSLFTWHPGDAEPFEYAWNEEAESDRDYTIRRMCFLCDGNLYAITTYGAYGIHSEFIRATLSSVELDQQGTAQCTPLIDLDWESMLEYYDEEVYIRMPESLIGMNGKAYMRINNDSGEYTILELDLSTGDCEELYDIRDAYSILPYKDGKLLIEQYTYSESDKASFVSYDPAVEAIEELCTFNVPDYSPYDGLAYDADTDTLYCLLDGEICTVDIYSGETGSSINDMPLQNYGGGFTGCILNGGFYVYASNGAVVRNINPEQEAQTRIRVLDAFYTDAVNRAVIRLSNERGDISVSVSRDYDAYNHVVENMMNQDSEVDIYVISTNMEAYDAVRNRGYMMELDGNEAVAEFAESIYPQMREALSYNGHLVAFPLQVDGYTLGVNEKALEQIGLTLSDIPTNWSDFLDFLANDLPEALQRNPKVFLFYQDATTESARMDLFYRIFEDYQNYVNATDPAMGYNTDLLRGLLEKLDSIDFTQLGCKEPFPEDEYDEDAPVIETYSDEYFQLFMPATGCTFSSFYDEETPILMSLDAEHEPILVMNAQVAFINPFSTHYDEAMTIIAETAKSLPNSTQYAMMPQLDQPIRSSYYETNKQDVQNMIDDAKTRLETADPADKQDIEELIRQLEMQLDYFEEYGWEISQRAIDWYRANDDNLAIASTNWLYSDNSGEASNLVSQYADGHISATEMLEGIDKKVQMMLLEGY